jgi:hypothetical protein
VVRDGRNLGAAHAEVATLCGKVLEDYNFDNFHSVRAGVRTQYPQWSGRSRFWRTGRNEEERCGIIVTDA